MEEENKKRKMWEEEMDFRSDSDDEYTSGLEPKFDKNVLPIEDILDDTYKRKKRKLNDYDMNESLTVDTNNNNDVKVLLSLNREQIISMRDILVSNVMMELSLNDIYNLITTNKAFYEIFISNPMAVFSILMGDIFTLPVDNTNEYITQGNAWRLVELKNPYDLILDENYAKGRKFYQEPNKEKLENIASYYKEFMDNHGNDLSSFFDEFKYVYNMSIHRYIRTILYDSNVTGYVVIVVLRKDYDSNLYDNMQNIDDDQYIQEYNKRKDNYLVFVIFTTGQTKVTYNSTSFVSGTVGLFNRRYRETLNSSKELNFQLFLIPRYIVDFITFDDDDDYNDEKEKKENFIDDPKVINARKLYKRVNKRFRIFDDQSIFGFLCDTKRLDAIKIYDTKFKIDDPETMLIKDNNLSSFVSKRHAIIPKKQKAVFTDDNNQQIRLNKMDYVYYNKNKDLLTLNLEDIYVNAKVNERVNLTIKYNVMKAYEKTLKQGEKFNNKDFYKFGENNDPNIMLNLNDIIDNLEDEKIEDYGLKMDWIEVEIMHKNLITKHMYEHVANPKARKKIYTYLQNLPSIDNNNNNNNNDQLSKMNLSSFNISDNTKKCSLCKVKIARFKCSRCGKKYCSETCQHIDLRFNKHEKNCF